MGLSLENLKLLSSYLRNFERTKFENEHLFGVWHGMKIASVVINGGDPQTIELPDFPDKWDYQVRQENGDDSGFSVPLEDEDEPERD